MRISKLVESSQNLFVEFKKLGVSNERSIEAFGLSLQEHYPLIKGRFTEDDFEVKIIKYPANAYVMENRYKCKIELSPNLKHLFSDFYPEALI